MYNFLEKFICILCYFIFFIANTSVSNESNIHNVESDSTDKQLSLGKVIPQRIAYTQNMTNFEAIVT